MPDQTCHNLTLKPEIDKCQGRLWEWKFADPEKFTLILI